MKGVILAKTFKVSLLLHKFVQFVFQILVLHQLSHRVFHLEIIRESSSENLKLRQYFFRKRIPQTEGVN